MNDYPAKYTVHCPSKPTNACEEHANAVVNLMRFMGAHVNVTKAPIDAQCDNCINENKNRK